MSTTDESKKERITDAKRDELIQKTNDLIIAELGAAGTPETCANPGKVENLRWRSSRLRNAITMAQVDSIFNQYRI